MNNIVILTFNQRIVHRLNNRPISECRPICLFLPFPSACHPLLHTHTVILIPIIIMGFICRYQVPVSLSRREQASLVKITLCSRTENKLSRQTSHLLLSQHKKETPLSRPEVARGFSRSQVSMSFTRCSPEPHGAPKCGATSSLWSFPRSFLSMVQSTQIFVQKVKMFSLP